MKITHEQYETAKKAVERAAKHHETMKAWEKAVKGYGEMNGKKILAVNVNGEKVSYEVE